MNNGIFLLNIILMILTILVVINLHLGGAI